MGIFCLSETGCNGYVPVQEFVTHYTYNHVHDVLKLHVSEGKSSLIVIQKVPFILAVAQCHVAVIESFLIS